MNQRKLIKKISLSEGIKKKKCSEISEYFWKSVFRVLLEEGIVRINNFGEFKIVRDEMRILQEDNLKCKVIPPKDIIGFEYYELSEPSGKLSGIDSIINDLSIEFILSKKDSEMIILLMLFNMRYCFEKKKDFSLENFGDFKVQNKKSKNTSVRFLPAKKLSKRANYNFNNLEVCKIHTEIPGTLIENENLSFKLMDDFREVLLNDDEEDTKVIQEAETLKSDSENKGMRKLISEEVVKLHKEITDKENEIQKDKNTNLWR